MKSIFLNIIKIIGALFLSICILSFLLLFYSITPVHMKNKKGNTDYVWPANSLYVKMTEGIAWGRFDANGYNNLKVIEKPDILLLGSSHMEATNVMQNKSIATLLNNKLDGKYTVYNMGISGHNFYKVCQYLPTNLELYENTSKMVIIETSSISLNSDEVNKVLNHTIQFTKSYSDGIIGLLQRVPFFRLLYHQSTNGLLKKFMNVRNDIIEEDSEENIIASDINVSEKAYIDLFFYLENLEKDYGVQIVIFYHPIENLNVDGTISFNTDEEELEEFKKYSDLYNINFIDMTSHFEKLYYDEHHVAHGFTTGRLAHGHLNSYGHSVVASVLYDEILKIMEDDNNAND